MTVTLQRRMTTLLVLPAVATACSTLALILDLREASGPARLAVQLLSILLMIAAVAVARKMWTGLSRCSAELVKQLETLKPEAAAELIGLDGDGAELTESALESYLARVREELQALREQRQKVAVESHLVQNRYNRLQAVLMSIPEGVIVVDERDRLVLANPPAEKMFGFSLPVGGVKKLQDCIQDKAFLDLLLEARSCLTPRRLEYSTSADDEAQYYDVIVSPICNGSAKDAQGMVAILRNVTRQKHASRMKTDFVANASHELRTPLGSIKACLEMLADGEVNDEQTRSKFYQMMQNEVNRLSNLVENILNISRIEAGIVKVSKELLPPTVIVKEVVDVLRPRAEASGIRLTQDLAPVFFHVRADKEMLRQAVLNLVSNAIKYTPQGGSVTVNMFVDEAAGVVKTEVTDTGVGISEQDLPRVFDKFYRVNSSKKMAKGTGLGLVLVKEIIETVHGGQVGVSSTPGKGSTFYFTLPLAEEKQTVPSG